MISSLLINNIYNFVNRIGVVHEEQIQRLFSVTHNAETISWCIKELVNKCKIDMDYTTRVIKRREYVCETDFSQKLLTQAAWLLVAMGESQIRDYWTTDYPSQLLIISEDNTVYDVTMFTFQTVDALKMTVCSKRKQLLPEGVEDEIVHIAVVPDKEMSNDIKPLGFDTYCILDENNMPNYYEWE